MARNDSPDEKLVLLRLVAQAHDKWVRLVDKEWVQCDGDKGDAWPDLRAAGRIVAETDPVLHAYIKDLVPMEDQGRNQGTGKYKRK